MAPDIKATLARAAVIQVVAELKADISDLQGKLNAAHEAKGVLQEGV